MDVIVQLDEEQFLHRVDYFQVDRFVRIDVLHIAGKSTFAKGVSSHSFCARSNAQSRILSQLLQLSVTLVEPISLVMSTSEMMLHSGDHMARVNDSFMK